MIEPPDPTDLDEPTWKFVLTLASRGLRTQHRMSKEDAEMMMEELGIDLTRSGGIPSEISAVFAYKGEEFTITKYLGKYEVFGGRWKPDPRWTGD